MTSQEQNHDLFKIIFDYSQPEKDKLIHKLDTNTRQVRSFYTFKLLFNRFHSIIKSNY